jgi:hypothetical protein
VFFKEMDADFFYGSKAEFIPLNNQVFTIHGLKPPYKITTKNTLTFFAIKVQPWANSLKSILSYMVTKVGFLHKGCCVSILQGLIIKAFILKAICTLIYDHRIIK